ncbi:MULTISPECIES: SDR family oxidoreductase [Burkholderia]|uniref:SDR family oxidoreductase n=1 Tax=Burkholderia TaxID=32008 RepID=UPI000B7A2219|nr:MULTISPECIES: SDR family oxidoreductase [unclassified Burkholderia]CAG2323177.1 NAD-dependent dehydratase [Burkholderia cenocepacia]OXI68825.1 NAD-dependent dehydratase [Burkholderia sp. AU31280]QVN13944.1 SDR family oxidoreductase [Burkholderia sp. LAS2]CAG2323302.1 NAD-dependent dehydratase [Burkholderia cenocepacia]CAG2323352.1 NAD-dependent dehydratase [Burkholderia cenocepacia]
MNAVLPSTSPPDRTGARGMTVLVCGANGFIGQALCARLEAGGHRVLRGVRRAAGPHDVAIDFAQDVDPQAWLARLKGVDVVINAVGMLADRRGATLDAVHRAAPCALFTACCLAGVRRVIQISALGVERGDTRYFASKRAADRFLQTLPIDFRIVRPALVYGAAGASARFFRMLASLPVHMLPAGGHQRLRPVHVDDLAEVVARLVVQPGDSRAADSRVIDVVGSDEVEYREMLAGYRAALGFPPAARVTLPGPLVGAAAALLGTLPGAMLTRDTWAMLRGGNTGDPTAVTAVLGRPPRGLGSFIGAEAGALRRDALAMWRRPVLVGALAIVWIWTAIASAFIHPLHASLALLAPAHLTGLPALIALYAASALDFAFGIATVVAPSRRLWAAQAALIVAYSAVIAVTMPGLLAEPFGPVLKNVPILAILLILYSEEHA